MCVCVCACVRACVCVRERERVRKRERVRVCVHMPVRAHACVYVCQLISTGTLLGNLRIGLYVHLIELV